MAQVGIESLTPRTLDGLAYSNQGRNLKSWWNFEDFIGGCQSSVKSGIWQAIIGGAGAISGDIVGTALRPGIHGLQTGTTAAGFATLFTSHGGQAGIMLGGGSYTFEADVYIPTLSDVAEEFITRLGYGDVVTGADFVDGVYFEYDRLTSTNWLRCTSSNSTRTKTDTGIPVLQATWTRIKLVVNADGTRVDYYINDQFVGSNTTNIPVTPRPTASVMSLLKSAGLTSRLVWIDWVWLHIDLTASR